jgi:hypothetical protein
MNAIWNCWQYVLELQHKTCKSVQTQQNTALQHQKVKLAIFAYSRKETKKIPKLFKKHKGSISNKHRNRKEYCPRR